MEIKRGTGSGKVAAALIGVPLAVLLCLRSVAPAQEAPPADATSTVTAPSQSLSIAEMLEDENFHYQPSGRRDPFKSLMILQTKQKDISLLPPIQQLDLDRVKIAGVVLDEVEGPRAMIKTPDGKTFVVKKGSIIGQNEGEVIEVSLQGIRVVEAYVDFMGRETMKEVFIKSRSDGKK